MILDFDWWHVPVAYLLVGGVLFRIVDAVGSRRDPDWRKQPEWPWHLRAPPADPIAHLLATSSSRQTAFFFIVFLWPLALVAGLMLGACWLLGLDLDE